MLCFQQKGTKNTFCVLVNLYLLLLLRQELTRVVVRRLKHTEITAQDSLLKLLKMNTSMGVSLDELF